MLFSKADVAEFINGSFEPVWESVRAVPIVRIDFGNGNVITRTLNGNIATYVCTSDGVALDAVPGIYNAEGYTERLGQLYMLHKFVHQDGKEKMAVKLKEYHEKQVEALKKDNEALRLEMTGGLSKLRIENDLKIVLRPGGKKQGEGKDNGKADVAKEDKGLFDALAEDTKINEGSRRLQVSEMMVKLGAVKPESITKRLYKEVLHADLDDPYLGLGETLFKNYPFTKEDKK